jgi:transcriptional regulator with XRE-family HTH domain
MDLRSFRESLGLTQLQFADAVGKSKPYVSQLETGAAPVPIKLALQIEALWPGRARAIDLLPADDARLLQGAINGARSLAGATA